MKYNKNIFPELTRDEFNDKILPLINKIDSLIDFNQAESFIIDRKYLVHHDIEKFPYYDVCMYLAKNIIDKFGGFEKDNSLFDSISFERNICESLAQILFQNFIRCFSEQIKEIKTEDETPNETYKRYVHLLVETEFRLFYQKYSISWVRTVNMVENRVKFIKKSIKLTEKHRFEIEKHFKVPRNLKIKSLNIEGDTHNRGSSVIIINFEDEHKVVFKPRSTSGECGYKKMIDKLNFFLQNPMLAIKVLNYDKYGFTEFVYTSDSKKDMKKVGQLAFFMYLMNASDMHYGNVMWTSNEPTPIDLETLFQPDRVKSGMKQVKNNAYYEMEKSVYGTGILPIYLGIKGKKGAIDVGFVGTRNNNGESPFKNFKIYNGFSSEIKVLWEQRNKSDSKLIVDTDAEKLILQHCELFVEGFLEASKIFFLNRKSIINIIRKSFENSKLRYIHNMTFRYEQLLRTLSDAEPSNNIQLAKLILARTGILGLTSSENISLSECKQLWNGDIPYFTYMFNDSYLYDDHGKVEKLDQSPEKVFIEKANNLCIKDIETQIRIIRLAFMAKLSDPHLSEKYNRENTLNNKKYNENLNVEAVKTIKVLSKELQEQMTKDRYEHLPKTWIGPVSRIGGDGWAPGVLGYDLYSGRIGPAVALAVAGKILKDDSLIESSVDVFQKSARILKNRTYDFRNLVASGFGAYSGIMGLFWGLHVTGTLLGAKDWIKISNSSMKLIDSNLIDIDAEFFDLISGNSGSLGMRYKLDKSFQLDEKEIRKVLQVTDDIIENPRGNDNLRTSGLAHGLGQVIWFLSIVMQRQPKEEIKDRVLQIDNLLTSYYTNPAGNIEIYSPVSNSNTSISWCNGISGLLVAYVEGYKAKIFRKNRVIECINQLKREKSSIGNIPIYCHGNLGVYETLLFANQYFPDETNEIIHELQNTVCSPIEIFRYFSNGKGRYTLSPGIMAGKSGALLHLCKLVDPKITISPITIQ